MNKLISEILMGVLISIILILCLMSIHTHLINWKYEAISDYIKYEMEIQNELKINDDGSDDELLVIIEIEKILGRSESNGYI